MQEVRGGACTEVHGLGGFRHFHCDAKNAEVCFVMSIATGEVYWHWRTPASSPLVRVWVWGYNGTPVTGDYDMWMVAPHISRLGRDVTIHSNKDTHGRSAASAFTTDFIRALNIACARTDRPVFNHGAEAQNVSFTQALDKELVVFFPGTMRPIMLSRVLLPGILHDLLLYGYLVVRNPKWMNGVTLGIEDMAEAAGQFPEDGGVRAGLKDVAKLRQGAASLLQARYREKQGGAPVMVSEDWTKRYHTLRYFRAIGRMPDSSDSIETLMLPPEALPQAGPGSAVDERREVVALGLELERTFKRTHFIEEDGHVSPVDQTDRR